MGILKRLRGASPTEHAEPGPSAVLLDRMSLWQATAEVKGTTRAYLLDQALYNAEMAHQAADLGGDSIYPDSPETEGFVRQAHAFSAASQAYSALLAASGPDDLEKE